MTRRFSRSQRAELFRRAHGLCVDCGDPLEKGWHADHRVPWSRGGPTTLGNGQALCRPCNLLKGDRFQEGDRMDNDSVTDANEVYGGALLAKARRWQREAAEAWESRTGPDFLITATPGSGKTLLALTLALILLRRRAVERLVVVAPTEHLHL